MPLLTPRPSAGRRHTHLSPAPRRTHNVNPIGSRDSCLLPISALGGCRLRVVSWFANSMPDDPQPTTDNPQPTNRMPTYVYRIIQPPGSKEPEQTFECFQSIHDPPLT